jgi:DNA-binding LacI/PurR family transcriptional regulator
MSKTLLYNKLYLELLELVQASTPGTKLPTVRSIMKNYNVSLSTVNRALEQLRRDGMIESQPGRGSFTRARKTGQPVSLSQIEIFFFGYESSLNERGYIVDLIHSLSDLFGQNGQAVRVTTINPGDGYELCKKYIDKYSPRAVITINLYNQDILSFMKNKDVAWVNLTPNLPVLLDNSIYIDNHRLVELWLEHLTLNGHRKIAFLHEICDTWYLRDMHERENEFYRQCIDYGIMPDRDLTVFGGFTPEESYAAIEKILATGKEFSAVIINDHVASGVYKCLHDNGLSVGKDVSVISVDDIELSSHLAPPLTTARVSRKKIAEKAVKLINDIVVDKKDYPPIMIEPELVIRDSVAKITSDRGTVKRKEMEYA